jgi:elongation factor P--beta-lysine ligase
MDIISKRADIIDEIRAFFKEREYLEVETPLVTKYPGMEPHLDYFCTEYVSKNAKYSEQMFLNHSPELNMKKLLGRGYDRIFQICKVFRNGEGSGESSVVRHHWSAVSGQSSVVSGQLGGGGSTESTKSNRGSSQRQEPAHGGRQEPAYGGRWEPASSYEEFYRLHNSEFTMLEWYRSGEDYEFMMQETEDLVRSLCGIDGLDKSMCGVIERDWERMSVREAFIAFANIDLDQCRTLESFLQILSNSQFLIPNSQFLSWDDLFFLVMLNRVEPALPKDRPVILYDYPASQAALSKKKELDPFWAERFEVYIDGVELCNAYGELCDAVEQRERLLVEQEERRGMGKVVPGIDEEFLLALENIEIATGNALGVDRLVMLLLGKRDVREVMVV